MIDNSTEALREDGLTFSDRDKVFRAIFDPGLIVGPRLHTGSDYEHTDHWRARAAIEAMLQLACESRSFAQAIEARQRQDAKTGLARKGESAVRQDASNPSGPSVIGPIDHE